MLKLRPPALRSRREELAPFQAAEAIDVRRKSDVFGERVDAYRAFFLQKAPFAVPSTDLSLEQVTAAGQRWFGGEGLMAWTGCAQVARGLCTVVSAVALLQYLKPQLPPRLQVASAYRVLDGFRNGGVDGQPSVTALMQEADELRKQQDLFELYVSEYVFLQRCMVGGQHTPTTGALPCNLTSCG